MKIKNVFPDKITSFFVSVSKLFSSTLTVLKNVPVRFIETCNDYDSSVRVRLLDHKKKIPFGRNIIAYLKLDDLKSKNVDQKKKKALRQYY